jgi:hypothetical protein
MVKTLFNKQVMLESQELDTKSPLLQNLSKLGSAINSSVRTDDKQQNKFDPERYEPVREEEPIENPVNNEDLQEEHLLVKPDSRQAERQDEIEEEKPEGAVPTDESPE